MIEKDYGSFYVLCDACGTALDDAFDSFQDAVDHMRAVGWKTINIGGEWVNYCPECAREMIRPSASEFAGI